MSPRRSGPVRAVSDHAGAAAQARELPGTWVLAAMYLSRMSSDDAVRQIRNGSDRLKPYQPPGRFDARTELTQDSADLWVRFLGDKAEGVAP